MRYTSDLRQYDNKIIECSYRNHQWHFHRLRTDKSFPNAKGRFLLLNFGFKIIFFFSWIFLETAFGKFKNSLKFLFRDSFLGAVYALENPITAEILCSLIDKYMKHNMH